MALRRRPRAAAARNTYTEWWWPPSPTIFRTIPAGYTSFEHVVRVDLDPGVAPYVMAHEFRMVGGREGFLGLEASAEGKSAVFSVPGASSRVPSCAVRYPWEEGRAYALRVWTDGTGWWSAAVGEPGGGETLIGAVQVPPDWRRLASWSQMWTQYRGGLARCGDLHPCRATFSEPTADEGTVRPQRQENRVGPGTCEGSSVQDVPGGVRHAMGG